jgi:hypothetical protein
VFCRFDTFAVATLERACHAVAERAADEGVGVLPTVAAAPNFAFFFFEVAREVLKPLKPLEAGRFAFAICLRGHVGFLK